MNQSLRTAAIKATIFLLISLIAITANHSPLPVLVYAAPTATTSKPEVVVNPTNRSSTSLTPGVSLTFDINIINASSISSFDVILQYNYTILHMSNIDTTSVLNSAGSVSLVEECSLDLQLESGPCTLPGTGGGLPQGYFELVEVLSGNVVTNPTTNSTTGRLVELTLTVAGTGFSLLHLVRSEVNRLCTASTCPTRSLPVPVNPIDGYFTNVKCGNALCTSPTVAFKITPSLVSPIGLSEVASGKPIQFEASANTTNIGAAIIRYSWDWGDHTEDTFTVNNTAIHLYDPLNAGTTVYVSLTVRDSYGALASKTIIIVVIRVWLELDVNGVTVSPNLGVAPGTKVSVTVAVRNVSTESENATTTLSISGQNVKSVTFLNMSSNSQNTFSYSLDTSNYKPNVYIIQAAVDPIRNSTGFVIQNVTSTITGVSYLQIIDPTPGGFGAFVGLSLPQFLGSSILIIGVAGFALRFLTRKRTVIEELP